MLHHVAFGSAFLHHELAQPDHFGVGGILGEEAIGKERDSRQE
jgi:hypothetical protein